MLHACSDICKDKKLNNSLIRFVLIGNKIGGGR